MKALTGSDRIKRVTRKRFRKMTPEELEEAQAAGKIPRGRQDDFYAAMIQDAQEKGDDFRKRRFQILYDQLLKDKYAKKRARMPRRRRITRASF